MDIDLNYPRKQFRRENWMTLNGEWDFAFDDQCKWKKPGEVSWAKKILVPFAPESKASGIHDTDFHSQCWYQKKFVFAKDASRSLLNFGAVDYEAHVWLNGQYLGNHTGGHTPFQFEISHCVVEGENTLTVFVKDDPLDLAKPRGKQDWKKEPHSIWYARTTGIWQTVWIEQVAETFIDHIIWHPSVDRWEIGVEAAIDGPPSDKMQLRVSLSVDGRIITDDSYKISHHEVHRRIAFSDPGIDDYRNELLWSPEKPTLIQAVVELLCNGEVIDSINSYTALRSVSIDRDRFLLNGRPYYMRLVLDQGYWEDSLMTAPEPAALRKDVELAKAAGFNGVRKHQKIEDPDYLFWADVLGLIVWEEMPSAYRFSHLSVERLTKEWMEVMDRDLNHPCIVMWVPFNESWGVPDLADKVAHQSCVQALYHLTKTLDPTRPVIGNDGWESTATDILGIHDYDANPDRLLKKYGASGTRIEDILYQYRPGGRVLTAEGYPHEGQPLMLTEFGGIACRGSKNGGETWGYSSAASGEDLKVSYEKLLDVIHRLEIFSGFCYTQFTDTFQEANGLFYMDRTPKFPLSRMERATRAVSNPRGELISVPSPPPFRDHDENAS